MTVLTAVETGIILRASRTEIEAMVIWLDCGFSRISCEVEFGSFGCKLFVCDVEFG